MPFRSGHSPPELLRSGYVSDFYTVCKSVCRPSPPAGRPPEQSLSGFYPDLKKTEKRISELEERDGEIDQLLSQPEIATDPQQCAELSQEQEGIKSELEDLYEKWESLAEASEDI